MTGGTQTRAATAPGEVDDPQSFAAFLVQHARGRTERDLSNKLRDLVKAVQETGKPGSLTLTIKIKPEPNADSAMVVADTITVKAPVFDRAESIFFADEKHHLVRTHPRQHTLDSL